MFLAPYLETASGTAGEFRLLRYEIGDAIQSELTDEQVRRLSKIRGTDLTKPKNCLCRLQDLEMYTGRIKETMSGYESGNKDVPDTVIRLMRLLARVVKQNPKKGADAIRDYITRYDHQEPNQTTNHGSGKPTRNTSTP